MKTRSGGEYFVCFPTRPSETFEAHRSMENVTLRKPTHDSRVNTRRGDGRTHAVELLSPTHHKNRTPESSPAPETFKSRVGVFTSVSTPELEVRSKKNDSNVDMMVGKFTNWMRVGGQTFAGFTKKLIITSTSNEPVQWMHR